jgi:hypothetical protein
LKVLENQLRSQAPQTAKASPIAPLTNATSTGQVVAGSGSSTDAFSRAIQTTVQGAISGIEALQYVQTQGTNFNLGSVTSGTLRTEFLRPDPVIGQVYRMTVGGTVSRGGVSPGFTFGIFVNITGSPNGQLLLAMTPGASTTADFFLQAVLVTTTAGTTGIMSVNSGGIFGNVNAGPPPLALISNGGDGCIQAGNIGPGTLIGGSLIINFTTTALSTGSTFGFNGYILESLGFRTG